MWARSQLCDTVPISNLSELWLPRVPTGNNNHATSPHGSLRRYESPGGNHTDVSCSGNFALLLCLVLLQFTFLGPIPSLLEVSSYSGCS